MNKDITFHNRISILVGINGSGKTSVLNLLNWLLTLNIEELCLIEFENITLDFKYEDCEYKLTCEQNEIEIFFNLENIKEKKIFPKIQATFNVHPKKLTKDKALRDSTRGKYTRLGPEKHEVETWTFIVNTLPSPTVIGLDRNLYTQEGNDFLRVKEEIIGFERITNREKIKESTPIDRVKVELVKNFNVYRNNVLLFYSLINRKIILSAFDDIITDKNLPQIIASPRPTIKEIEILQEQVKDFLRENKIIMSRKAQKSKELTEMEKVDEYFSNLKNILKQTEDSNTPDLLYLINVTQFKKINDLVIEFKKYEEVTIRLYKPLEEFLNTMNGFFKDSSKELYFNKATSQIFFNILDNKGRKIDSDRDIENLSSGEKQILILLTHIKYNLNLNLFIIDEPELSLHPKWQGEFLEAVEKLMPKDTQLILATHSPEIVGDNEEYCEVLLPYN
jgi:predicted ATPase